MTTATTTTAVAAAATKVKSVFPSVSPAAPSAIPKSSLAKAKPKTAKKKVASKKTATKKTAKKAAKKLIDPITVCESLVLQIVPHHNGEVLLSKVAINQNPSFFGFPFTGRTTPKKAGKNAAYPQRDPDPVVNINVYDDKGTLALKKDKFALNTVFYEAKGEIRITISSDILKATDKFSILHLQSGDEDVDYYMDIYNPGSSRYDYYLAVCDQTLPSGGAAQARKMGWL